jgi:hypothetical protein
VSDRFVCVRTLDDHDPVLDSSNCNGTVAQHDWIGYMSDVGCGVCVCVFDERSWASRWMMMLCEWRQEKLGR